MYSFSSEWIHKQESQLHWIYYWHQIRFLLAELSEGDTILEIGVGTKFTANYLKSKGYHVTTIDIDKEKNPDIVANIVDYNFVEKYDHVIAFEVFEHIPYDEFKKILEKIRSICNKGLLISLPRNEKVWLDLNFELPGSKKFRFKMATKRNKILTKNHHWEVDYKQYTKSFLEEEFNRSGFKIDTMEKVHSLLYYSLKKG